MTPVKGSVPLNSSHGWRQKPDLGSDEMSSLVSPSLALFSCRPHSVQASGGEKWPQELRYPMEIRRLAGDQKGWSL